jgi:hypothetical protein
MAIFNRCLTICVKIDLGNFLITFLEPISNDNIGTLRIYYKPIEIEIYNNNILYSDGGISGSLIQMGYYLNFGLRLNFTILPIV